jgi:tetratricopeptide (TPR) repeat protein
MGDTIGAIKDLRRAIHLDSTNTDALNDLAWVYNNLDSTKLTLFYAKKAIAIDSSSTYAYNTIAIVYMSMEKYDSAVACLNKCIMLDSIESLSTGYNGSSAFYDNRSECKLKTGDTQGALQDVQRAIALNSTNDYAYYNLALVYEKMGEKEKACEALNTALGWGFTEYNGDSALKMKARLCGE